MKKNNHIFEEGVKYYFTGGIDRSKQQQLILKYPGKEDLELPINTITLNRHNVTIELTPAPVEVEFIYYEKINKWIRSTKQKKHPLGCEWCGKEFETPARFFYCDGVTEYAFCSKLCMNHWEQADSLHRIANKLETGGK